MACHQQARLGYSRDAAASSIAAQYRFAKKGLPDPRLYLHGLRLTRAIGLIEVIEMLARFGRRGCTFADQLLKMRLALNGQRFPISVEFVPDCFVGTRRIAEASASGR